MRSSLPLVPTATNHDQQQIVPQLVSNQKRFFTNFSAELTFFLRVASTLRRSPRNMSSRPANSHLGSNLPVLGKLLWANQALS